MSAITESRRQSSITQVAVASWIGTSIEWYDFFLYSTASALVLGPLFFSPKLSPLAATLAAFATFWVGFAARPVGGIVFGHFGDRIGRKAMLVLTLTIMGLGTFLVGLMPTYSVIGIWAPILLVILRFSQGFAVGGEWGGAVLMAVEHSPADKRGFYGSWPQMGVPIGLILSSLLFSWVSTAFSHADFLSFGWRIPFLLSSLLVVVGLFILLRITETQDFEQVKESHEIVRVPIVDVLRHNFKNVILAAGAFFVVNGSFYLFITFILTYNTLVLKVPTAVIFNATIASAVVSLITLPVAGALSDRFGRLPVYLSGAILMAVGAFPIFWLIDMRSAFAITLALCLGQCFLSLMYGPQAAFFSELFGTKVRYSGASLGYQGASIFAGGLAPFIATALLGQFGNTSWSIAVYLILMSLVTLLCTFLAGETRPATDTVSAGSTVAAGD